MKMLAMICALVGSLVFAVASPAHASTGVLAPVTGSFTLSPDSGPVGGVFELDGFQVADNELVAAGTLSYALCVPGVDPKNCLANLTRSIALPVTSAATSCCELTLTLAQTSFSSPYLPTGLIIELDPITLTIDVDARRTHLLDAVARRLDLNYPRPGIAPMLMRLVA
jgi:hypothetical protein